MGKKKTVLPDGSQVVVVEKKGMGGCGLIMCIVAALFIFFVVLPMGGCSVLLAALGFAVNEGAEAVQEEQREKEKQEEKQRESESNRGGTKMDNTQAIEGGDTNSESPNPSLTYFADSPKEAEKNRLIVDGENIDGILKVSLKEDRNREPSVKIIYAGGIKQLPTSKVPLAFAELWGFSDQDVSELKARISKPKAK